jgi:hypothetical protein
MKARQAVLFLKKKNQKDLYWATGSISAKASTEKNPVMAGLDPAWPPPAIHALTNKGQGHCPPPHRHCERHAKRAFARSEAIHLPSTRMPTL